MTLRRRCAILLSAAGLFAPGCTGCPTTGTGGDAGNDAGGGRTDAGSPRDAGHDAGHVAGTDAGAPRDAGTTDANTPPPTDAGGVADAAARDAGNPFDNWPFTTTGSLDPVPGVDAPGVADAGCSTVTADDPYLLDVGASTTHRFTGTVSDVSAPGTFYVFAGTGREIVGTLETDTSGNYAISVPLFCGFNEVKFTWTASTCSPVVVHRVLSSACTKMDLRITILWDTIGRDWELHLVRPGGRINDPVSDCTWTTCINASPDWGRAGDPSDDPHKDVDDLTGFGPESIYLPELEAGTYTVMVEHWNSTGSPLSDGQAIINLAGQVQVLPRTDLAPYHVWTVATVSIGTITAGGADHDCSANWSAGCRDAIP